MIIEFDKNKSNKNIKERGLSFNLASDFEIETALISIDFRQAQKELRFNCIGFIKGRLFHITCAIRNYAIRIISLRKANNREIKCYAGIHNN